MLHVVRFQDKPSHSQSYLSSAKNEPSRLKRIYSRVSVVRLSVVSPTRLCVQLVHSHPEYFTWRCMEDYFHLYVPLSSTSKFLSPDVNV